MNPNMHAILLLLMAVLNHSPGRVFADCAPFYDSLNDIESVKDNGGEVTGDIDFAPGVNGNGVVFGGNGHITYPNSIFDADAGSVSFWFKNDSPGSHEGFFQIGAVGQPTRVGLSHDGNDVCFQMHDDTNGLGMICGSAPSDPAPSDPAPRCPVPSGWNHVVCMWDIRDDERHDMWLFINGAWAGSANLPGPYTQTAGQLEIGYTTYHGHAVGMMDELRFFDWALSNGEVYAEYVYSRNCYVNQPTGKPISTGGVQVIGKSLYVDGDGQPFLVRGVGYQPTPIDSWPSPAIYTGECIMERDIRRLRGMGVNTIRLWSDLLLDAPEPDRFTLLDACYNGGVNPIYVIMGFRVPTDVDYSAPNDVQEIEARFSDYVTMFKAHPAVLAWGIGNENNLHYQGVMADWYALANTLACDAYTLEGEDYHPTIVINGDMTYFGDINHLSDDLSMSCVDMWGHNAYPGEDFHCYFDYYDRLSAKPLIITEYGIDAYDADESGSEYQCMQAEYDVRQWRQIKGACVGGTIMAYSDEWWKAGCPCCHDTIGRNDRSQPDGVINEEWWGLFAVARSDGGCDTVLPRKVACALSVEFHGVTGDSNLDNDVDLVDFAAFQRCFGSPLTGGCCDAFDFVADGSINLDDFNMFTLCLNGPGQPIACNE